MQLQNAKSGGIRVGMVRALGLKKHSFFFNLVLVATKNHLDPNLSLSKVLDANRDLISFLVCSETFISDAYFSL